MKSRKIKNSPPKKVVDSIRKELTSPYFPYKNVGLSPDATPLEKNKYDICQKILAYKQDNKLTTEKVARNIQLTTPETEDIFFGRINKFTLDRLVSYATNLGIFLQVKEVSNNYYYVKLRIIKDNSQILNQLLLIVLTLDCLYNNFNI